MTKVASTRAMNDTGLFDEKSPDNRSSRQQPKAIPITMKQRISAVKYKLKAKFFYVVGWALHHLD